MKKKRQIIPPLIDGYEYQSYLGSGGFADVFLYQQYLPERLVAVKVLHADVTDDVKERFHAEANVMAKLSSHPSIVSIYAASTATDGRSYIVMEYCPPPHVGKIVSQKPYSVPQALEIGIQLGAAIETAHRAGIIHRDIKPANVLMTAYGRPVLTDFGIASSGETQQGFQGVSLLWAPAEQQTGKGETGPRCDVFSLGATIYALLAGHSPFKIPGGDNSPPKITARVLNGFVPSTGRSDVPRQLENVIRKALSKDPQQRYATALEFVDALHRTQRDIGLPATHVDVLDEKAPRFYDSGDEDQPTRIRALPSFDAQEDFTKAGRFLEGETVDPNEAFRFTVPHPHPLAVKENQRLTPVGFASATMNASGKKSMMEGSGDGFPSADFSVAQKTRQRTSALSAFSIFLVLILLGALVATLWYSHSFDVEHSVSTKQTQSVTDPQNAGIDDIPPPVKELKVLSDPQGAKVSWVNPLPQPGDSYLWEVKHVKNSEGLRETKETSVVVPWEEGACCEVSLRRANGQTSLPEEICKMEK
ncbi:MAG: serine/threonine-protein kinase [Actinomycetaceae bacterium]|nr:serine/threonine-protein kinase [Actinomycetaceae bacterium]MDO5747003.1 serine/threonine-protein kinase [Actinomycetaceae bacterium]